MGAFFQSLLLNDSAYSYSRLCALGVLLSAGSAKAKAAVMFDLMDSEIAKTVTKATFERQLHDMISVAAKSIPLLVGDPFPAYQLSSKIQEDALA
jgi:hypothetical protein